MHTFGFVSGVCGSDGGGSVQVLQDHGVGGNGCTGNINQITYLHLHLQLINYRKVFVLNVP